MKWLNLVDDHHCAENNEECYPAHTEPSTLQASSGHAGEAVKQSNRSQSYRLTGPASAAAGTAISRPRISQRDAKSWADAHCVGAQANSLGTFGNPPASPLASPVVGREHPVER